MGVGDAEGAPSEMAEDLGAHGAGRAPVGAELMSGASPESSLAQPHALASMQVRTMGL